MMLVASTGSLRITSTSDVTFPTVMFSRVTCVGYRCVQAVTRENITVGNVTSEVEVIRNEPVEATNIMGE